MPHFRKSSYFQTRSGFDEFDEDFFGVGRRLSTSEKIESESMADIEEDWKPDGMPLEPDVQIIANDSNVSTETDETSNELLSTTTSQCRWSSETEETDLDDPFINPMPLRRFGHRGRIFKCEITLGDLNVIMLSFLCLGLGITILTKKFMYLIENIWLHCYQVKSKIIGNGKWWHLLNLHDTRRHSVLKKLMLLPIFIVYSLILFIANAIHNANIYMLSVAPRQLIRFALKWYAKCHIVE